MPASMNAIPSSVNQVRHRPPGALAIRGSSVAAALLVAVTLLGHAGPAGSIETRATVDTLPPPAPPFRAPFVPTADDEVLQDVPKAADPNIATIRTLRAQLDRKPRDLDTANALAKAYIDFGRQVGDAHYVGYAEAVLAPWLAQKTPPVTSLVLYAVILQYRHQFAPARDQLKRAIAMDATNGQAWLTLATLDMVQGDYETAARDCQQVGRGSGTVVGLGCSANLISYLGQAKRSIAVLTTLASRGQGLPPAISAWIEGLLAESAERIGDWPTVEAHYRKALTFAPDDNFLLVAYADFLLDRGRPAEVLQLLQDFAQSDTAFLRLVLAQAALKNPDLPRYAWVMAARFEALAQRGDDLFGREQVRFALHGQRDAATALDLAQQNWKVQRAPWDIRVFLEAALAANQPAAALPALEFLDRTKLEDPVIEPLARELRARLAKAPKTAGS